MKRHLLHMIFIVLLSWGAHMYPHHYIRIQSKSRIKPQRAPILMLPSRFNLNKGNDYPKPWILKEVLSGRRLVPDKEHTMLNVPTSVNITSNKKLFKIRIQHRKPMHPIIKTEQIQKDITSTLNTQDMLENKHIVVKYRRNNKLDNNLIYQLISDIIANKQNNSMKADRRKPLLTKLEKETSEVNATKEPETTYDPMRATESTRVGINTTANQKTTQESISSEELQTIKGPTTTDESIITGIEPSTTTEPTTSDSDELSTATDPKISEKISTFKGTKITDEPITIVERTTSDSDELLTTNEIISKLTATSKGLNMTEKPTTVAETTISESDETTSANEITSSEVTASSKGQTTDEGNTMYDSGELTTVSELAIDENTVTSKEPEITGELMTSQESTFSEGSTTTKEPTTAESAMVNEELTNSTNFTSNEELSTVKTPVASKGLTTNKEVTTIISRRAYNKTPSSDELSIATSNATKETFKINISTEPSNDQRTTYATPTDTIEPSKEISTNISEQKIRPTISSQEPSNGTSNITSNPITTNITNKFNKDEETTYSVPTNETPNDTLKTSNETTTKTSEQSIKLVIFAEDLSNGTSNFTAEPLTRNTTTELPKDKGANYSYSTGNEPPIDTVEPSNETTTNTSGQTRKPTISPEEPSNATSNTTSTNDNTGRTKDTITAYSEPTNQTQITTIEPAKKINITSSEKALNATTPHVNSL